MGAGDEREHFFQDLGESYYVLLCQIFVTSIGLNITSVDERQTEFDNYCLKGVNIFPPDVDPKEKFLESCYAMNATKFHKVFIDELINNYQGCIFDFNDVESDYRNRSLKGDFVITIKKANDHALMNYRQHTENPSAILNDVINSSGGIEGWYNYNPSQMPDDPFTKLISVSLFILSSLLLKVFSIKSFKSFIKSSSPPRFFLLFALIRSITGLINSFSFSSTVPCMPSMSICRILPF